MKKALSLVALLLILAVGPAQANRYDLQLGKLVDDGCNIS